MFLNMKHTIKSSLEEKKKEMHFSNKNISIGIPSLLHFQVTLPGSLSWKYHGHCK